MNAPARLQVVHETHYTYSSRVDVAYHQACLHPRTLPMQDVVSHVLEIEPEPTQRSERIDAFGNARDQFAYFQPHEALAVRMHSEVVLQPRDLDAALDVSVPWEEVAEALRYRAGEPWQPASEFAFASHYVPIDDALRAYAASDFTPGRRLVDAAFALTRRMHREFTFDPTSTEVGTHALEALQLRRGVCQDFSHVMIGCLRSLGLAARYVSGYLLTHPAPGRERLVGADASHAWVSVWCLQAGWVDLDPTNGIAVDREHLTIGWGRDYLDVPPLRGVIHGGGAHTLQVAVTVTPLD